MSEDSMRDPLGAFMPGPAVVVEPSGSGPLDGLTFAAKDIYDMVGTVTGRGNPEWQRSHDAASANAPSVQALLDAGARLVGKTITDEFAYSLNGCNHHYGTPTNSNAPGRIPGGSSNGSASAVAGGAVDFALGSDTGGSVRIPASYCGLYGIRTTHGAISLDGIMPLAPSLDTVGWFTRDASLFRKVGEVLLGSGDASAPSRLLIAEDAFARSEPGVNDQLQPLVERLKGRLGGAESVQLGEPGGGLDNWVPQFRAFLGGESWISHGDWVENHRDSLGPECARNFDFSKSITDETKAEAKAARAEFTQRLHDLLAGGTIVCLPTAPGIAPRLDSSVEALADHRYRVHGLTCTAGLAGLPQVSIPLASLEGCPLGLSLIGAPGSDLSLLALAESFVASLESEPDGS